MFPYQRNLIAAGMLLAVALVSPAGAQVPAPAPATERWFQVLIDGQAAGHMVERQREDGGRITSESEMALRIARGGATVTLAMASGFAETAAGEAIEMWSRQEMGTIPVELKARFLPDGIELSTQQGAATTRQILPKVEGPWLTPARADRLVREKLAAGAASFSYRTLDPEVGPEAIEITYTRLGEPVELILPSGRARATPYREAIVAGPQLESTVYLDRQGEVVKSETSIMGLTMTLVRSDREGALAQRQAPEVLTQTFIRPRQHIRSPRTATRVVYRVSSPDSGTIELPETGSQTVVAERGKTLRVTVSASARRPGTGEDPKPYLRASSYLNLSDPRIIALKDEALRGVEAEPVPQAEALRAFVHRYLIHKDLGTGFATATEVAASRRGDCTEHAVLLAALLRAAGIPARVVSGLLYVEEFAGEREVFGYHMWAEALIGGSWLDLDAMTENAYDAAHIALGTATLNDGEGFGGAALDASSMLASLAVEVLEVEH